MSNEEQRQALKAMLAEVLGEMGIAPTTPVTAPEPTEVKPAVVTSEAVNAALGKSEDFDVLTAQTRHEAAGRANCVLCIPCTTLFRKGSKGPERDKHTAHSLVQFADDGKTYKKL